MNKTQVVKRKCCGVIFAACIEPECYIDKEWLQNLKRYIERGDTVDFIERGAGIQFGKCECGKQKTLKNS